MSEEHKDCGWVKLWHKKGVLVTFPLRGDINTFDAQVNGLFDQGWLAVAPGLEEGEEKEEVGWILRGAYEKDGQTTPFVLLYATNEAMTWSFLKVYLNKPADVAAFEFAAKTKLADLPDYIGDNKPQRGAAAKTDAFIKKARPFGVVFKKNPKHDDTEAGKMKPARLFVRWADQAPTTPAAAQNSTPGPATTNLSAFRSLLNPDTTSIKIANFELMPMVKAEADKPTRAAMWNELKAFMLANNCVFDEGLKQFISTTDKKEAEENPIPW